MFIEKYIYDSLSLHEIFDSSRTMKVDNIVKYDVIAVKILMPFFISFYDFNFSYVRKNRTILLF